MTLRTIITEIVPGVYAETLEVKIATGNGWLYRLHVGDGTIYQPDIEYTASATGGFCTAKDARAICKTRANALKQAKRKWQEIKQAGRERFGEDDAE